MSDYTPGQRLVQFSNGARENEQVKILFVNLFKASNEKIQLGAYFLSDGTCGLFLLNDGKA